MNVDCTAKDGPMMNDAGGNTTLCKPAGSGSPEVVHTMVRLAAVKVHEAVSAAEPDTGTRVPAGDAAPVK